MNKSFVGKWFFLIFAVLCLSSCFSIPKRPYPETSPYPERRPIKKDVYHTVAPGETVWRLAKMYDVKEKDILGANALRRANGLKMGQRVRIPRASPIKPVVPLISSKKWKYIIIHHSATDEGNSLAFHKAHLKRGFDRGVGYHFVIDNGSKDKINGQIEVTPRWIKQQDGAHCKAFDMNKKAIGICLVGNYSEEWVSDKQLKSLVYLVGLLSKHYGIPKKNIMGHTDVPEASTECPGLNFPWGKFWKQYR